MWLKISRRNFFVGKLCVDFCQTWKVSRTFVEFDADGSGELSVEELESLQNHWVPTG